MFDLADKRLVWIPVKWPGVKPSGKDGALAENTTHEIDCQVELVDRDRFLEIFGSTDKPSSLTEIEMFKALVHDWRGVRNGRVSAPMTPENIAAMLKVPMFASGFNSSYIDAWSGQMEEREKNSKGSSADGPADAADAQPETEKAPA